MDLIDFIINTLKGEKYLCDRCTDVKNPDTPLGIFCYLFNKKNGMRYCSKCWNYIHLKTWVDNDGNIRTLRSEKSLRQIKREVN